MPKAVQFDSYGGIDVLEVRDVPRPVPGHGEVLVQVKAAGINPSEAVIRSGALHHLFPATFPSGQGSDLAGAVAELGPGVNGFTVGDEVIGFSMRRSSQAEYVIVPANQLTPRPSKVPWEVAGSLFMAGVTAYAAVRAAHLVPAKLGMNLQTSTLKFDETGDALHIQQAAQIRAFRAAWKQAGHTRTPRISVSRSIFALIDDRDRTYFGRSGQEDDKIGFLDESTKAIFGRSYAAEPDILIEQLRKDEAIALADTLLLTIPNQLGVAYNAHVMEAILTTLAPALGWR